MLSKPTWSVRSLLPSAPTTTTDETETITPAQLHHLLRLSALPLPKTQAEEESMLATLQSQLHFVRAVREVDTTGVEPLQAIRDETDEAARENTVTLDRLRSLLDSETRVGHYQRPRRVRDDQQPAREEAEDWDALSTASKKAGRFFVVQANTNEGSLG